MSRSKLFVTKILVKLKILIKFSTNVQITNENSSFKKPQPVIMARNRPNVLKSLLWDTRYFQNCAEMVMTFLDSKGSIHKKLAPVDQTTTSMLP